MGQADTIGDATSPGPPAWNRILLHCPEITLKGRNQGDFRQRLHSNIAERLRGLGRGWRVISAHGRACVECEGVSPALLEAALAAAAEVAGVESVSPTVYLPAAASGQDAGQPHWQAIEQALLGIAASAEPAGRRFAVRANRVDKRFPVRSRDIEARLGARLQAQGRFGPVDLDAPERRFHVDIYPDGLYLYTDRIAGVGGLPVGSGGRVLALLSSGIDSPVAAALLARRGCNVDFLHVAAGHAREAELLDHPVALLAARLSCYTLHSRLTVVPYTFFDLSLPASAGGLGVMLFRRFMLRVGAAVAARSGALALCTGDALGQVASQTLDNMVSASMALSLPVLRPLVAFNKQEIIARARRLGTYELSLLPAKDCCALLEGRPRTRTRPEQLAALEARCFADYDALLARTLAEAVTLRFAAGRRVDAPGDTGCWPPASGPG